MQRHIKNHFSSLTIGIDNCGGCFDLQLTLLCLLKLSQYKVITGLNYILLLNLKNVDPAVQYQHINNLVFQA